MQSSHQLGPHSHSIPFLSQHSLSICHSVTFPSRAELSYMYSKHMLSSDIRHFVRGWLTYFEFYILDNTIEDKFISKIDNSLFIGADSIYNPPPHFFMGIKLAQNKDVCIDKYLSS